MKSFIAALAFVAVEASSYHGSYGYPQPSYQQPSYQQPSYSHQPSYGYGHNHPVQTRASPIDPWSAAPANNAAPTGWYSPTMQYSPVRIPYSPGTSKMTQFATCDAFGAAGFTASIQLAQAPGKASSVKTNITAGTAATTYRFELGKFGDITQSAAVCDSVGTEFRPLQETDKYGRPNAFQDPARGRIASVTLGAAATTVVDNIENNVLLNLSGKDTIIGRSISVYDMTTTAAGALVTTIPVACCVIGIDESPLPVVPTHYHQYGHQPSYSHQPSYGYGHGHQPSYGYGHGHH